jgi:uncharacterized protein YegL
MNINDFAMSTAITGSGYNFTAQNLGSLGATEYTLATIVVDISSSVSAYRVDIENTIKAIVSSLRNSPRAEHLMVRILLFNSNIKELHGFKELSSINESDYDGIHPSGTTALYDATRSGIDATISYGKTLTDSGYPVNGIVYIITDGEDNASSCQPSHVATLISTVWTSEVLEGMTTVLIGLGSFLSDSISRFEKEGNLTHSLVFSDASVDNLNKLGNFVQQSVLMMSSSLTGSAAVTSASLGTLANSLRI